MPSLKFSSSSSELLLFSSVAFVAVALLCFCKFSSCASYAVWRSFASLFNSAISLSSFSHSSSFAIKLAFARSMSFLALSFTLSISSRFCTAFVLIYSAFFSVNCFLVFSTVRFCSSRISLFSFSYFSSKSSNFSACSFSSRFFSFSRSDNASFALFRSSSNSNNCSSFSRSVAFTASSCLVSVSNAFETFSNASFVFCTSKRSMSTDSHHFNLSSSYVFFNFVNSSLSFFSSPSFFVVAFFFSFRRAIIASSFSTFTFNNASKLSFRSIAFFSEPVARCNKSFSCSAFFRKCANAPSFSSRISFTFSSFFSTFSNNSRSLTVNASTRFINSSFAANSPSLSLIEVFNAFKYFSSHSNRSVNASCANVKFSSHVFSAFSARDNRSRISSCAPSTALNFSLNSPILLFAEFKLARNFDVISRSLSKFLPIVTSVFSYSFNFCVIKSNSCLAFFLSCSSFSAASLIEHMELLGCPNVVTRGLPPPDKPKPHVCVVRSSKLTSPRIESNTLFAVVALLVFFLF